MRFSKCLSAHVTERPDRTARGYRRFRCLDCTKQFNERSGGLLNRTQYPSDVIALVVLWRQRRLVAHLSTLAEHYAAVDRELGRDDIAHNRAFALQRFAPTLAEEAA